MSETKTEEKKAPAITKFGGEVIASVRQLAEKQETVTCGDVANLLGKAVTIVAKSAEKLAADGYLTVTAGDGPDKAVYALTENAAEQAKDVVVEAKKKESDKKYRFLSKPEASAKVPPQMLGILEAAEGFGEGVTIGHDEFMTAIGAKIVTRQTPNRVFQFYRQRMLEGKYLEEVA